MKGNSNIKKNCASLENFSSSLIVILCIFLFSFLGLVNKRIRFSLHFESIRVIVVQWTSNMLNRFYVAMKMSNGKKKSAILLAGQDSLSLIISHRQPRSGETAGWFGLFLNLFTPTASWEFMSCCPMTILTWSSSY